MNSNAAGQASKHAPQVFPFAAVPMVEYRYDRAAVLNPSLSALFVRLAKAGDGYRSAQHRDTQHGLFESKFDLHLRPEPEVQELFRFLHWCVAYTVRELNGYSAEQMARIRFDYHTWFHVTEHGGFQGIHNHPNASWSGIYCVDPGDDDGNVNSGAVRFHDPRGNADMYSDPGNQQLIAPFHLGGLHLRHEAGRMIMFPSYLMHEVFAYTGQRSRIVVAFNCWSRWER